MKKKLLCFVPLVGLYWLFKDVSYELELYKLSACVIQALSITICFMLLIVLSK